MDRSRRQALRLLCAGFGTAAIGTQAQTHYPSAPIRLVIPTPAGGGLDALARLFGQHLTAHFGQPTVVESRPGGNASIAALAVLSASPDGQTLLMSHSALQLNTITQAKPQYRMSDFVPVVLTARSPIALAVNSSVMARDVRELVAEVRASPGRFSYATYGAGSVAHFMGEALNIRSGLDMVHVPYKGAAPALIDLVSGRVQVGFGDVASFVREERATGKVRVLGVSGQGRFRTFPQVQTFVEQGFPELDLPAWHGIFARASTPAPIVEELGLVFSRILALPEVRDRVFELGFEPAGIRGAALERYLRDSGQVIDGLMRSGRFKLD